MDVAVRVRRRRALPLTLSDVLETAPQVAEYLVPYLTNHENNLMVAYLCRATNYDGPSGAVDYYIRVYFTQCGLGYALRPPARAS